MGRVPVPALLGVSFNVKKGEFLTIFGPSGSGKSTLLYLMGGLDRPDDGEILIEGANLLDLGDDELAQLRLTKIGFIFQFFNLLPKISAVINAQLPLEILGLPEIESFRKATKMLELVGLESRMDHRPSELSGGEQQRVAIARALANNPKFLLMDEPTGNIDSKTANEIVGLINKLNEEKGVTIIMVTHDQRLATQAKRTVQMFDGLIIQEKVN